MESLSISNLSVENDFFAPPKSFIVIISQVYTLTYIEFLIQIDKNKFSIKLI